MKAVITIGTFLLAFVSSNAQSTTPSAQAVLKPVYAQAASENKKVLLLFHASWCGWCRKMDTALQDPTVQPLIDKNYITTHLTVYESKDKKDLENPGALPILLANGGGEDQGIPYWLVLDKNGKVLANSQYKPGHNSGCPATEAEVVYFIGVLRKTSALKEEALKAIEKRFRMNEQPRSTAQVSH